MISKAFQLILQRCYWLWKYRKSVLLEKLHQTIYKIDGSYAWFVDDESFNTIIESVVEKIPRVQGYLFIIFMALQKLQVWLNSEKNLSYILTNSYLNWIDDVTMKLNNCFLDWIKNRNLYIHFIVICFHSRLYNEPHLCNWPGALGRLIMFKMLEQ